MRGSRYSEQLIVPVKPGNAGGGKGVTGRCAEEGNNAGHRAYKSIVNGTESAQPGIKLMPVDLFFPAKVADALAARCLVLNDGMPMGSSFRSGYHSLPPIKKFVL